MEVPSPAMYEERLRLLEDERDSLRIALRESVEAKREPCPLCEIWKHRGDEFLAQVHAMRNRLVAQRRALAQFNEGRAKSLAILRAAFADCLLALDELDHPEVSERLRERWPEASTE